MNVVECLLYDSGNYRWCSGIVENKSQYKTQSDPVGIVLHSTGDGGTTMLKRYVQPSLTDPNYDNLIKLLGKNTSGNSWNRPVSKKCVHYMIGQLADHSIATAQLLPEDFACWGIGSGSKGSYNYYPTQHIQIEMQDGNNDKFDTVYQEAVDLCVNICKRYNWDENIIVSHKEAHKLGYGSNHADCDLWFSKHGKTMNDLRNDVKARLIEHDYKVKDIVDFIGDKQWTNANKADNLYKSATQGRAQITKIYSGTRHPYLVKATAGSKSNVYGYVNADEIQPIEEYNPKVGEKVNFVGSKQWSNANRANLLSKKAVPCVAIVKQIYQPQTAKHPYLLSGSGVNGWVNKEDIEKINLTK